MHSDKSRKTLAIAPTHSVRGCPISLVFDKNPLKTTAYWSLWEELLVKEEAYTLDAPQRIDQLVLPSPEIKHFQLSRVIMLKETMIQSQADCVEVD